MCKVSSDYMQTCHLWLRKCPSHLSHDTGDNILEKCHDMLCSLPGHLLWHCETGPDMLLVGCSAHMSSAELHENRIRFCLFFGPLYKMVLKRGWKESSKRFKIQFSSEKFMGAQNWWKHINICTTPSLHMTFPVQHVFITLPENGSLYEYPLICKPHVLPYFVLMINMGYLCQAFSIPIESHYSYTSLHCLDSAAL